MSVAKELADKIRKAFPTKSIDFDTFIKMLVDSLDPPVCEHDWEDGMIFKNTPSCIWVKRCRKCYKITAPVLVRAGEKLVIGDHQETIFEGVDKK